MPLLVMALLALCVTDHLLCVGFAYVVRAEHF